MTKLLTGTVLASVLILAGCGDDEEAQQKARIEANAALLKSQQLQIDATVPQIADLTAQLEALQTELAAAESTIAAKNAAEARLAELQAESDVLNAALAQIENYQARALTVAPTSSEGMVQSHDVSPVKNWDLYRVSDRTTGLITYKFRRGQVTLNYANLSPQAQEALTECYNAGTCMKLSMSYSIEDGNYRVDRLVDWDARVIFTYTLTDVGAPVQAFSFDELLNAEELHAEADALRAELNSQ